MHFINLYMKLTLLIDNLDKILDSDALSKLGDKTQELHQQCKKQTCQEDPKGDPQGKTTSFVIIFIVFGRVTCVLLLQTNSK